MPRAPCSPPRVRGAPSGSTPGSVGSPVRPSSADAVCRARTNAPTTRSSRGYDVPNQSFFTIGLGMVAPTILAHGSTTAKDHYLQAMYRGDIVACQLFSEPGAGSDLASLQTKAERDGDEWVITGQKVWTTGAHYSDIGEIIARTDPELPKHKGLTGFIVDMRAPGVEVRPLRQMTGGASFNEVFFNEVKVPDADRLGDLNNGWNVALTTLMNERSAIGAGGGGGNNLLTRIIAMTKAFGLADDPLVRQELADLVIRSRVQNMNNQRALDKIRAGQLPGPEMSMAKLGGTMIMRRMGDYRVARARAEADRRHRRVGHVRVEPAPARHARRAHRRWQRRGDAQHRRRTRAGPAEGRRHRLHVAVPEKVTQKVWSTQKNLTPFTTPDPSACARGRRGTRRACTP